MVFYRCSVWLYFIWFLLWFRFFISFYFLLFEEGPYVLFINKELLIIHLPVIQRLDKWQNRSGFFFKPCQCVFLHLVLIQLKWTISLGQCIYMTLFRTVTIKQFFHLFGKNVFSHWQFWAVWRFGSFLVFLFLWGRGCLVGWFWVLLFGFFLMFKYSKIFRLKTDMVKVSMPTTSKAAFCNSLGLLMAGREPGAV